MVTAILKKIIPKSTILRWRSAQLQIKSIPYRMGSQVECHICLHTYSRFMPFRYRKDALCPSCKSLERHRYTYLYLRDILHFYDAPLKKVLHFAPEKCLWNTMKNNPDLDYVTADYMTTFMPNIGVMPDHVMSIDAITFPDETFDVVIAIGILLMVKDDFKAMREVLRVLKPGGYAIFQDPVNSGLPQSIAADTLTPEQRKQFYHGHDQRWYYGADYGQRLTSQGFHVTEGSLPQDTPFKKLGIWESDRLYLAYKK